MLNIERIRTILTSCVLVVTCLIVSANCVKADSVDVVLDNPTVHVTEGNTAYIAFTLTNNLSESIWVDSGGAAWDYPVPDLTDGPKQAGVTLNFGTCYVFVAPGASCTLQWVFPTAADPGETDHDFGMTPVFFFGFGYETASGSVGYTAGGLVGSLTVRDVGFSAAPEPSSLILLGSGLLGIGGILRRRCRG